MIEEKFEARFKNPHAPATWKQVTTIANNLAKRRGLHYPSIRNAILAMVFVEKGSYEIIDDPLTMQEAHELIQLSLSDDSFPQSWLELELPQEIMDRYEKFLPTEKKKPLLSSVGGKISEMVEKLSPAKTTDSSANGLYQVEKGVPLDIYNPPNKESSAFSKTLKVLEVGDSFWVPINGGVGQQIQTLLCQQNQRLNTRYGWKRKIRTRTQKNDGVIGVRVWRVE